MANSKPLLIIQTGNTFPAISASQGDFGDWIGEGLGAVASVRLNAHQGDSLPAAASVAGVVVSGSHAMVSDREPWSEALGQWLEQCVAANVPLLCICYGHQLLAQAMGGQVGYRTQGLEMGTQVVNLAPSAATDALFHTLPPQFPAQLVHSQSVLALPPGATLLASSAQEPHQAFRIGERAWGVQFHPEFSAEAMRGYLCAKAPQLGEPQYQALRAAVQPTPAAYGLLQQFALEVCGQAI